MRWAKGESFIHLGSETKDEEGRELPTFSEGFLYERVGKDEARFILAVAEEYEHVIEALGTLAVKRILDVKPKLARRLGLPEAMSECLADAISTDLEYRESEFPEVMLDYDGAKTTWSMLHDEYRRFYNPEESMDRGRLRLYHLLTEELGNWCEEQRQKEIDRLPEKLEKQAAKLAEREATKA